MLHTTFVQIAQFDCLMGRIKGEFSIFFLQNSSSQKL